jgi:hypothetical protein
MSGRLLRLGGEVQHIYVMQETSVPWFQSGASGKAIPSFCRHPVNSRQNLASRDLYASLIESEGFVQQLRVPSYAACPG